MLPPVLLQVLLFHVPPVIIDVQLTTHMLNSPVSVCVPVFLNGLIRIFVQCVVRWFDLFIMVLLSIAVYNIEICMYFFFKLRE